jgi:hypothetical protein
VFGEKPLNWFLQTNNLSFLIRSHEVALTGVNFAFPGSIQCITVFSTSDYCVHGNVGGVVYVNNDLEVGNLFFEVLTVEQKAMRRILFPEWLFQDSKVGVVEVDSPPEVLRIELAVPVTC